MKKEEKKILIVIIHIVSWLIFLSLPAAFNSRRHGISIWRFVDDFLEPPRWTNALLLVTLFYTNYYFLIPRLYIGRKYVLFLCSVVWWFGIFFLVNYMMMPEDIRNSSTTGGGFEALGNSFNLFMFLVVYALSFSLCLNEQWQKTKEQMLNTEISFLKAQINPHFLFNALNSIYSLALTKSDSAPDAVIKLSGMMRYTISETNQHYVSLSREIEYINNYIDLQRLRVTDSIKINYMVKGNSDGKHIAPFLLIPFVENAFKHGVNSEQDSDISISIEIGEENILLNVGNKKVTINYNKETGTGIGIDTTRKRLSLLYPGKHRLNILDNNTSFNVSLQINL